MSSNIFKKNKKINNKTRKNTEKLIKATSALTPEQREIVCKTSANTYTTFEDKIDEIFKKNSL
jgi:hypothetical protein